MKCIEGERKGTSFQRVGGWCKPIREILIPPQSRRWWAVPVASVKRNEGG